MPNRRFFEKRTPNLLLLSQMFNDVQSSIHSLIWVAVTRWVFV